MPQLQEKHEKFVRNYLVTRNATASAKAAGYSQISASVTGSKLLKNPDIIARIAELDSTGVTDIDVILEIEKQYEYAKNNNHTQSALKALELLTKVKDGIETENPKSIKDLEEDIVRSLEILGEERAMRILMKCSFFSMSADDEEASKTEMSPNEDTEEMSASDDIEEVDMSYDISTETIEEEKPKE